MKLSDEIKERLNELMADKSLERYKELNLILPFVQQLENDKQELLDAINLAVNENRLKDYETTELFYSLINKNKQGISNEK